MTWSESLLSVIVAQFPISLDIQQNQDAILSVIAEAKPDTLVVLPEGALSGYAEDPAFLQEIDYHCLAVALRNLQRAASNYRIHLVFGSCLYEDGHWYNAGLYFGLQQEQFIYRKLNLAMSERSTFSAGSELPVITIDIAGQKVPLGIQLCREIRFPEQWQYLARAGARIFAYLTNAAGNSNESDVWRSHLVSRAAENQRFVLAANTAHPAQKCPSMIVTPTGHVVWETRSAELAIGKAELDIASVSDWYLSQSRRDLF